MRIESPAFSNNESISAKYTCDGADINPPLTFVDIPEEAKSLVLIMDDPDVPRHLRADGIWDHWIVFNISPSVRQITEGKEPTGVQGMGTGGGRGYQGPCPPDREHRYFFKLYALDTMLGLPEGARKQEIEAAMQGHVLAQSQLVGRYNRQI